ncbi:hypothetical protein MACJ_001910 [Theileria orientalis]|uniref:Uncharacterized protein n=1 Tax=Theileria orientalis TaxID=68886 RepID=A0A976M6M0_THEOR|nr:hypothetical protein MACJ_001910 [Theileria orientalis]
MIRYIEDNDGFTLDELVESIVSEKIFNINEDKIFTRLASAIKRKFSTVYDNTSTNIFVRASLADSTYKSQSNILFTTHTLRNEVNSSKPRIRQKPTILNWFKRDASKTVEKKEVKQECVYTEEEPSSNIIPVDIDPFGTLVITGEMLAFSSDDESNLDTERTHLKDMKHSSNSNARFAADEDDETCLDDNSLNNWSTDDCSQSSKSVDFDVSDVVVESNNKMNEKSTNQMDIDFTCYDIQNTATGSCNEETADTSLKDGLVNEAEITIQPVGNVEIEVEGMGQSEHMSQPISDVQMSYDASPEDQLKIGSVTNVEVTGNDDDKGKENVVYLGNNIIVLYGSGNNTSGCYWLLSKVFDCEFKTLITNTYQENEFIIIQNKKVQHIDCTLLKTQLNDELISVEKLKDILLNRHSQVCVLEHFDHLGKSWQILMSKWFNKVYEKMFIILCCNLNHLDFRVRSYSLVLRLNGLDRDKFIDHTHKMFLRSYNMPNKNYMNTRNYVMNANKNRYCLSRLNMIEIANRVDFDLILFFNTLVDAQRNYMNAIRKHKTKQSHKWLRNLIHIILHSSQRFVNLKSSVRYTTAATPEPSGGGDPDTAVDAGDNSATSVGENTPTVDKPVSSQQESNATKLVNDVNKTIVKLITDIIAEYGVHELDLMLTDFYNRLIEMGSLELEPLKPDINRLISNMFVDKPLDDDLTDLEVKINCMKFLVYDLMFLIQDLRVNSAS